jgi:hypothetical protein
MEFGLMGDCIEEMAEIPEVLMDVGLAVTGLSVTPFGDPSAGWGLSAGACEDSKMALPSSESASKRSGGRRSFSISDLRLKILVSQLMDKLAIISK